MTPTRHLALVALAFAALGAVLVQLSPRSNLIARVAPAPAVAAESPEDAATRVLALPVEQRLDAATALLNAVADRPEVAVRLARKFCDEDTAHIREHGEALIQVLAGHGRFAAAFRFAEQGGPERSEWLPRALQLWLAQDPVQAAQATLALAEGDGFTLVANTWAGRDPAGLADFVLQPRAASADSAPLEPVLVAWLEQNPGTVNAWLDRLD